MAGFLDKQNFANQLRTFMHRDGLTQSDLARALWGTEVDGSGKARNRDRISKYLNCVFLPNADTLKQLCEIFATTPEELAPTVVSVKLDNNPAEPIMEFSTVAGEPEMCDYRLQGRLPLELARQIGLLWLKWKTQA